MGKSNNLNNNFYHRNNNLNEFLQEDEIKIFENINNNFLNQFERDFVHLTKKNIELFYYPMNIESFDPKIIIKHFQYCNLIEVNPSKDELFIIFSENFLSIMIDLFFGGRGNLVKNIKTEKDITPAELFINKKIVTLIMAIYSDIFKKYLLSDINLIYVKTIIDFKKNNFNNKKLFLINSFHFNINNIKVFFSVWIPLLILKNNNKNKLNIINNTSSKKYEKKKNKITISLNDIYNVKLNINIRIIDVSISYNEIHHLSVGDVLLINKPDKIVGFIEKNAVFSGQCKRFHKQTIVFIEEFINNLESNSNIRNTLVSNKHKNSDYEKLTESQHNISQDATIDNNSIFEENCNETNSNQSPKNIVKNEQILLKTFVKITVELGKSKIKIQDFLNLSQGSILTLDKSMEESLDIFINGYLIASGEIVVLENKYGVRITKIKKSLKTMNISV